MLGFDREFGEHGKFCTVDINIGIIFKELFALVPCQIFWPKSTYPCGFLEAYYVGVCLEDVLHLLVVHGVGRFGLTRFYKVVDIIGQECETFGAMRYFGSTCIDGEESEDRSGAA